MGSADKEQESAWTVVRHHICAAAPPCALHACRHPPLAAAAIHHQNAAVAGRVQQLVDQHLIRTKTNSGQSPFALEALLRRHHVILHDQQCARCCSQHPERSRARLTLLS
jgi:hypothetical protein